MSSMIAPLRVGLVGAGRWTQRCHLPNLLERPDVVVTAVCARRAESRAEIVTRCPLPPSEFASLGSLIDAQAADLVIIATPDATHAPLCIQAMEGGMHVFCENPLALTSEEAAEVSRIARATGRVAAAHLELRYADVLVAAREAVAAGRIGATRYATMVVHRDWQSGEHIVPWRTDPTQTGGQIFETWLHYLDAVSWVLGQEPAEVRAQAIDPLRAEAGAVLIHYANGALATVDFCFFASGSPEEVTLDVVGTNGRLCGTCIEGVLRVWSPGETKPSEEHVSRPVDWTYREFPGTREALADVIACIRKGGQPVADLEGAILGVALAQATRQAVESGATVRFGESLGQDL